MKMRRLGVLMVVLALAVTGLAFVQCGGPVAAARLAVSLLGLAGPPEAAAQVTTMTFENVPPESVAALEVRSGTGRHPRVKVTVSTDEPVDVDSAVASEQIVRSGDMTRVGDDIHVKQNEIVHGDVVTVLGGDAVVDGTVQGDVVAVLGGDIYLNATARVDGDVVCIGGELHEEPGAYVSGKRVTGSGGDFGMRARHLRGHDWERAADGYGMLGGVRLIGAFLRFLLAIGVTLLVAWLFRGRITLGAQTMRRQPGLSFGVGALVLVLALPSAIALAVVSVLLIITLIGIPLAVVAALGYALFFVVFVVFGLTIGATVVGEWLTSRRGAAQMAVWQYALLGVLLLGGVRFVGRVFEVVGVFGFHALGILLIIVAVSAAAILGTIGGGAWLKWEFSEGLFGQWRGRWQGRNGRAVPPAAAGGSVSAPQPPPPDPSTPAGPDPTPGT
jgi:hypothetical protein